MTIISPAVRARSAKFGFYVARGSRAEDTDNAFASLSDRETAPTGALAICLKPMRVLETAES